MPSALDLLAAAISEQQVDDSHVVVSALPGSVESLLRRDAEFDAEFDAEVAPREDATPALAPQQPAQP